MWPQRLELRRLLGQGWLGELYVAQDLDSPRQVVTRLLAAERVAQAGALAEILRLGAATGHAHILPTTLPEENAGQVFYTMQFAEAGSLRSLWLRYGQAGQRVDPLTLLDIMRQVVQALVFAHEQGVVHGNLKPENVLLQPGRALLGREGFNVLVSDFGLNSLRPADPASSFLPAPQRAGAVATESEDWYGVGAMLFEGLTGKPLPLNPVPTDIAGLPDRERELVARCLGWPQPVPGGYALLELFGAPAGLPGAVNRPVELELFAEHEEVQLRPGEQIAVRLRLQAGPVPLSVRFAVEGLPGGWVVPLPAAQLSPRAGAVALLTVQVPREAQAGSRAFRVVALRGHEGGELLRLAEVELRLQVLPVYAGSLELTGPAGTVRQAAELELELHNAGNAPARYELELRLPPGARLTRSWADRPVELAPGAVHRESLTLDLPASWFGRRPLSVTALARRAEVDEAPWQATAELVQRPRIPLWAALALLTGLVAAGAWASRPPQILDFTLVGQAPVRGEPFRLAWQTSGARQVSIAELPSQAMPGAGEREVSGIGQPQTYTLVARGWFSERQKQLTVRPLLPGPRLQVFQVTPPTAAYGQVVQVRWQVPNASRVQIAPFGVVPAQGTQAFTVTHDTTFSLRAQGGSGPAAGEVRGQVRVTLKAPNIETFEITPARVRAGESVTVRWNVTGARQVRAGELGVLPPTGTRTLVPTRSGPLVLKASNGQQEVTATARITVIARPARVVALSVPSEVVVGQPLRLKWQTADATRVELRWGTRVQQVPVSGEWTLVASPEMRNLSLFASGPGGEAAVVTRQVVVSEAVPPPGPAAVAGAVAPESVGARDSGSPVTANTSAANNSRPPVKPAAPARAAPPSQKETLPQKPGASSGQLARSVPAGSQGTSVLAPSQSAASVTPPVQIISFRVFPASARVGEKVNLRWEVKNETQVMLSDGQGRRLGVYPARGQRTWTATVPGVQVFALQSRRDPAQQAKATLQVQRGSLPQGPQTAVVPPTPPAASTSSAPSRPAPPQPQTQGKGDQTPAIRLQSFTANPRTVRLGERSTLSWEVSGAKKVFITGLSGPNPDGSFGPVGSVSTNTLLASQSFTLKTGALARTVRVSVLPTRPSATAPAVRETRYAALGGDWQHNLGRLKLVVEGNRVTGTILSSQPELPSEFLSGVVSGEAEAPTITGFIGVEPNRVALLLHFDLQQGTFQGFYSGRSNRQKWCGWRGNIRPQGC